MSIANKELFEKEQMEQKKQQPTYWWLLVVFIGLCVCCGIGSTMLNKEPKMP